MNKWLFRFYILIIFIGFMMITDWLTFAPIMIPMGAALIALSVFCIMWEGTPKGRIKGIKYNMKK